MEKIMQPDDQFRKLLLDIADEMDEEDIKKFCFLIKKDVTKKDGQTLIDIFRILYERQKIGADNVTYLINNLEGIKRVDLAFKVMEHASRNVLGNWKKNEKKLHLPLSIPDKISEPVSTSPPIASAEKLEENSDRLMTRHPVSTTISVLNELIMDQDADSLHDEDLPFQDAQEEQSEPSIVDITGFSDSTEPPLNYTEIDLKLFESDVWSNEFLQQINLKILPYNYQIELIQKAIQAQNTLVCLRTGAGKTYVAAILLKYYFIKKMKTIIINNKNENNKQMKTTPVKFLSFFFVPKRSILRQQADALRTVQNLRVTMCDDTSDVKHYIHSHDVIVCTPQKLVNCLKAGAISLNDVDVMIFDECHNSVKQHPYCQIMQYLLCWQEFPKISKIIQPPVIIGLTASIGLRGSSDEPVIHNLIVLCATLDSRTICAVTKQENEQELKERISCPTEDKILVINDDLVDKKLLKDMKDLVLSIFIHCNPSKVLPDKDVDSDGYEQNLVQLLQTAQKNQNFELVIMLAYVILLMKRIQALHDLPSDLVINYLNDSVENLYRRRKEPIALDTEIYNRCKALFKIKLEKFKLPGKVPSQPKLDLLIELIKQHAIKNNNRGLILVQRTFYAKNICDFLKNHPDLKEIVFPDYLVGQNSGDYRKTSREQDLTLKHFHDDLVQEGLDVPQCSYVIRYEFVSDEIGTVQARGRARASDSSYYLITTKDSKNHEKEKQNRIREEEMQDALESWKKVNAKEFEEKILEQQKQLVSDWVKTLHKDLARLTAQKPCSLNGEILCRSCSNFLGQLAWLKKRGTCYFVSHPRFLENIENVQKDKPKIIREISISGKAFCGQNKCRAELGGIQKFLDHAETGDICVLKCDAVKIKLIKDDGTESIVLAPKWTELPFSAPAVEETPN
ncbi:unnamed protein product [Didymodactylos carnosus]|uniref:RNA helicase n=1 Tax=Didymodactylos carnosus TaxID=1234261 RepID=A0A814MY37_9BILA|nr:unnamed protein product [Didymodactylos carnosus]CAF3850259.1 unnamed protein product [Didymodactylos carnosus]